MLKITEKEVYAAAQALKEAGKRVTVTAVRDKLGRGSYSTITPIVSQWREEQAEKEVLAASIPDGLADATDDFVRRLWLEASKLADVKVVAAEKASLACEEALEKTTAELEAEVIRLEEEKGSALQKIEQLELELEKEKDKTNAVQIRAAEVDAVRKEKEEQLRAAIEKVGVLQQENGALSAELKIIRRG